MRKLVFASLSACLVAGVQAGGFSLNYVKTVVNPTLPVNNLAGQEISSVVVDGTTMYYSGWPSGGGTTANLVKVTNWDGPTPAFSTIFSDTSVQGRPTKLVLDGSTIYFGASMGATSAQGAAQMTVYRVDSNGTLIPSGNPGDPFSDGILEAIELSTANYQDMAMDPGFGGNNTKKLAFVVFGSRAVHRADLVTGSIANGYLGIDPSLAPAFWTTGNRGLAFDQDGNGLMRIDNDLLKAIRSQYESGSGSTTVGWSGAELLVDQPLLSGQWMNIAYVGSNNGIPLMLISDRSVSGSSIVKLLNADGTVRETLTGSPQGAWTNPRNGFAFQDNANGTRYLFISGFKGSTQGVDVFQVGFDGQATGTVTLGDWAPADALYGRPVAIEVLDGSGNVVDRRTQLATVDTVNFSFFTTYRGTGKLRFTSPGFLAKNSDDVVFGSAQANASAVLVNGDIDGDNEVGGGDLSEFSINFLAAWDSGTETFAQWITSTVGRNDLDGDGEVGSSDLSILSANFLLGGD